MEHVSRSMLLLAALACIAAPAAAQVSEPPADAATAAPASLEAAADDAEAPADATAEAAAPAGPAERFNIDAIDVTGNSVLPQDAIERAVYPHLGPDKTADDLEAARAALEKSYHDRGYQAVFVQIPEQSTTAGVFTLLVTEARVTKITVNDGGRRAEAVTSDIPALRTGEVPNLGDVERQITAANRFPERQITPAVVPGAEPGTIEVSLDVERRTPLHASLQLTNDHNQGTEPLRLSSTVRHSDLWELGHQITLTTLLAPQNTDNLLVLSGSYLAPLSPAFSVLVFGYTSNSNIATLGGTNVLGDGYAFGVRGVLNLPAKSEYLSHSVNFGFDYKDFKEDIVLAGVDERIQTPIDYATLNGSYQLSILTDAVTVNASIAATAGLSGLGRESVDGIPVFGNKGGLFNADANFVHLNIDADATFVLKGDFALFGRIQSQLSSGPLVSNEQFAAGGLYSVRGYFQSEGVGDEGLNGTFELQSPSFARSLGEWIDELRMFGFIDAAAIRVIDPGEGVVPRYNLLSAGVGTRFRLLGILSGDAALGWPVLETDRSDGPVITFSVKAEY